MENKIRKFPKLTLVLILAIAMLFSSISPILAMMPETSANRYDERTEEHLDERADEAREEYDRRTHDTDLDATIIPEQPAEDISAASYVGIAPASIVSGTDAHGRQIWTVNYQPDHQPQPFTFPATPEGTPYRLSIYGASGGNGGGGFSGGQRGRSTGVFTTTGGQQWYFVIGQRGETGVAGQTSNAFGGGGIGRNGGGGGGGSSFVSTGNANVLTGPTRDGALLVAGGGGGAGGGAGGSGFSGGGLDGQSGTPSSWAGGGGGATQTTGGGGGHAWASGQNGSAPPGQNGANVAGSNPDGGGLAGTQGQGGAGGWGNAAQTGARPGGGGGGGGWFSGGGGGGDHGGSGNWANVPAGSSGGGGGGGGAGWIRTTDIPGGGTLTSTGTSQNNGVADGQAFITNISPIVNWTVTGGQGTSNNNIRAFIYANGVRGAEVTIGDQVALGSEIRFYATPSQANPTGTRYSVTRGGTALRVEGNSTANINWAGGANISNLAATSTNFATQQNHVGTIVLNNDGVMNGAAYDIIVNATFAFNHQHEVLTTSSPANAGTLTVNNQWIDHGATATFTATPALNWFTTADSWTATPAGLTGTDVGENPTTRTAVINEPTSVNVNFIFNEIGVIFNINGGTAWQAPLTGTANVNRVLITGEQLNTVTPVNGVGIPVPTRTHFNFTGWNTAANGSGTTITETSIINSEMTLFAQWERITLTVTFDPNGTGVTGMPTPPTVSLYSGTALGTQFPTPPTRTGYTFGGWNTAANGSGTTINANTVITENMTVFAQWNARMFTVTFNPNGGALGQVPATRPAQQGNSLGADFPTASPTRQQWAFTGWNTQPNGSGNPFDATTIVEGNITVFAQWERVTHTVTFDPNGAGVTGMPSPASFSVNSGATLGAQFPTVNPERAGYVFAGWNTQYDGYGVTVTANRIINSNQTFYAMWQEISLELRVSNTTMRRNTMLQVEIYNPGNILLAGHTLTFTPNANAFTGVPIQNPIPAQIGTLRAMIQGAHTIQLRDSSNAIVDVVTVIVTP